MQVVPAFDPLEYGDAGFGLRLEPTPIEQLLLEGREEAFSHGVVVGITDRAQRRHDPHLLAALAERDLDGNKIEAVTGVWFVLVIARITK